MTKCSFFSWDRYNGACWLKHRQSLIIWNKKKNVNSSKNTLFPPRTPPLRNYSKRLKYRQFFIKQLQIFFKTENTSPSLFQVFNSIEIVSKALLASIFLGISTHYETFSHSDGLRIPHPKVIMGPKFCKKALSNPHTPAPKESRHLKKFYGHFHIKETRGFVSYRENL